MCCWHSAHAEWVYRSGIALDALPTFTEARSLVDSVYTMFHICVNCCSTSDCGGIDCLQDHLPPPATVR